MIGWILLGIVAWYLYSSGALDAVSDSAEQAISQGQTQAQEILQTIIPAVQRQTPVAENIQAVSNLQYVSVGQIVNHGQGTYRVVTVGGGGFGGVAIPVGSDEPLIVPGGSTFMDMSSGLTLTFYGG